MNINRLLVSGFILIILSDFNINANKIEADIVVSKDGSGNFLSISEAIESLPMYNYERTVIFIKNGIYNEKFKIECDYVTLVGESVDSTIIQFNLPREDWIKNPDHIGPAVVNIYSDDIIFKNLTIQNTQPKIGPHAFAIYGTGTRTILINCKCKSKGGDTVSLWNYKNGMYYHTDCYFEGSVDFICPRGWCYIKNSEFYEHKQTAAIWHAGVVNPNQKFVLDNCEFDGVEGYYLGRHHYEAQFYLLNCTFSSTMKDKPIEHVIYKDNPEKNRPYFYGDRYFFFNCNRKGGNYKWFADNTREWPKGVTPDSVSPFWTFDKQWDPEDILPLKPESFRIEGNNLYLYFSELVSVRGNVVLKTPDGNTFKYIQGRGRNILQFTFEDAPSKEIKDKIEITIESGDIYAIQARVKEKKIVRNLCFH